MWSVRVAGGALPDGFFRVGTTGLWPVWRDWRTTKSIWRCWSGEAELHRTADSVVRIIGDTRRLFSSDLSSSDREKYSAEILKLEKELFEIRNRIGVTANEIGTIEEVFIVSRMWSQPQDGAVVPDVASEAPAGQSSDLVRNAYFRENLPQKDYEALL